MEWEPVLKKGAGRGHAHGIGWLKYPCIAIVKAGIRANRPFMDAFGVAEGTRMFLFFDKTNRRIGLKKAINGEDVESAFTFRNDSSHANSLLMSSVVISKTFPDCQGRAFRAMLNASERVIEVSLCTENIV